MLLALSPPYNRPAVIEALLRNIDKYIKTHQNYHLSKSLHYTTPRGMPFHMHSVIRTSSNGNIFRVTGPLCGEFTGHRWIPLTKASDVELWCFLWSAHWINGWVNNREAGDLRRHRAHCDAIVMVTMIKICLRILGTIQNIYFTWKRSKYK